MLRKLPLLLFLVLLAAAMAGGGVLYFRYELRAIDRESDDAKMVRITEGMTSRGAARLLKEEGLIRNEKAFYLAARYPLLRKAARLGEGLEDKDTPLLLMCGVYRIKARMDAAEILSLLTAGKTESIKVTIPEGLTIKKTAARLEKAGVCNANDFVSFCYDKNAASRYSLAGETLEGYLFPDTYFFEENISAAAAALIMVENFKTHVKDAKGADGLSSSQLYSKLIVASIVEREYRAAEEAPLIASVFYNRIRDGMGLYSCATIEYIITEVEGRPHPSEIKYSDLERESAYNTYKWASLPPTPISNPGMVSIEAALSPAVTDYYYFRLADAESDRHIFSKTFEGHVHSAVVAKTKRGE